MYKQYLTILNNIGSLCCLRSSLRACGETLNRGRRWMWRHGNTGNQGVIIVQVSTKQYATKWRGSCAVSTWRILRSLSGKFKELNVLILFWQTCQLCNKKFFNPIDKGNGAEYIGIIFMLLMLDFMYKI